MAGQNNQDLLQQTVDSFAQRVQDYAQGVAGRLGGQPMSGTQLSKDEAVQRWNFSPLGSTSDADAAYHQLVAQGTPPGQALGQVYPMRSMLIQGSDLQDSIDKAKQIAGWAADAAGTDPPKPYEGSTMPIAIHQQVQQQMQSPQPGPPPPLAAGQPATLPSLPTPPVAPPSGAMGMPGMS